MVASVVTELAGGPRPVPLSLPAGMVLVMGDVCGGSDTPSMVRKVLQWRKEKGWVSQNPQQLVSVSAR